MLAKLYLVVLNFQSLGFIFASVAAVQMLCLEGQEGPKFQA